MSDSNTPAPGSADDPWEQLAENLFGLDYGKEHAAAPAPEAPPSPPEASEPPPGSIKRALEEPPLAIEAGSVETASPVASLSPSAEELSPRPATVSAQDSYWDALANWAWDDAESAGAKKAPEPRKEDAPPRSSGPPRRSEPPRSSGPPRGPAPSRSSGPPRREERRSGPPRPSSPPPSRERPAPRSAPEPAEDFGDFGSGIAEPASAREMPAPESGPVERLPPSEEGASRDDFAEEASESTSSGPETADRDEDGGPRKRRRRRRRRGRGGREEAAPAGGPSQPRENVPGEDWEEPEQVSAQGEARPGPSRREERPEGRRRDSRSRSGRDRPERREPPAETSLPPADEFDSEPEDEVMTAGGEGGAGFDDEGDASESVVNYADVPTWEEAISYLLNPNQVQADGGDNPPPSRGSPPGSPPRSTRHYGGRGQ